MSSALLHPLNQCRDNGSTYVELVFLELDGGDFEAERWADVFESLVCGCFWREKTRYDSGLSSGIEAQE